MTEDRFSELATVDGCGDPAVMCCEYFANGITFSRTAEVKALLTEEQRAELRAMNARWVRHKSLGVVAVAEREMTPETRRAVIDATRKVSGR